MVKLGLVYCCFLNISLECHQNVRIAENEGSICEPGRLRCRQTMTLATAALLHGMVTQAAQTSYFFVHDTCTPPVY
jgi:hypothetical protein